MPKANRSLIIVHVQSIQVLREPLKPTGFALDTVDSWIGELGVAVEVDLDSPSPI
jgi:hypothetical protein